MFEFRDISFSQIDTGGKLLFAVQFRKLDNLGLDLRSNILALNINEKGGFIVRNFIIHDIVNGFVYSGNHRNF